METKKKFILGLCVSAVLLSFLIVRLWQEKTKLKSAINEVNLIEYSQYQVPGDKIGCKKMVDTFCTHLYSKEAQGNLQISGPKLQFLAQQGHTKNNFDAAWFAFYKTRLENKERLPKDLRAALTKRNFFSNLNKILSRPNKKSFHLEQGIDARDLEEHVDRSWESAVDETILRRLEKKYQGSFKLTEDEITQEVDLERSRIKYHLWSEISIALWSQHPRWKTVEKDFEKIRGSFRTAIENFPLAPTVRKAWLDKLKKIKLTIPGQTPLTANMNCIGTSRNAHYYPYLNTITVCAGYFNGGEQIQTLAHELAHAFDYNSRLIDFQQATKLSTQLKSLREVVCKQKPEACSVWNSFREQYQNTIEDVESYAPEIAQFHACLQKNHPSKQLTPAIIAEKTQKMVRDRFSKLTENSSFFRLTSPQIPTPLGDHIDNPNLMNPCAYELWDNPTRPLDTEFNTLLFFTAAYRCEEDSPSKLRKSIEISKEMTGALLKAVVQNEREFSPRYDLQSDSLSSPPIERFADRLASFAVAEYLKQYPKYIERRAHFLASSFWLCDKPNLRSNNYEQFQTLSDLIIDKAVHPENEERFKDWLSKPMREQLACRLDFQHQECHL